MIRSLRCPFTPAEFVAAASELARLVAAVEAKEREKKDEAARIKEEIDELADQITALASDVREGGEYRPVECIERPDVARFVVDLYRLDTGELAETRRMTDVERELAQHPPLPGVDLNTAIKAAREVADEDDFDDDDEPGRGRDIEIYDVEEMEIEAAGVGTSPTTPKKRSPKARGK